MMCCENWWFVEILLNFVIYKVVICCCLCSLEYVNKGGKLGVDY